jgi:hypothetical protein
MVQTFCENLARKHDIPILLETQPHRPDEQSLFKTYVEEGTIPALTVGHVDDIADLPFDFVSKNCRSVPGRFPLRKELSDIGFSDSEGYIHPFAVVPFAMFYNRNVLSEAELPATWKDLLTPRWQGKILMPDAFRIVSVVIKAFLQADFPEEFGQFSKNFIQQGSPPEVVSAVDEGRYPIGITNIAFARISRHKNTRIIWPRDGLFCMPQVMVFRKDAPAPILEIGDYLMSREIQDFLSRQSFVGASPEAPLHPLVADNGCCLKWEGWNAFLAVVRGRHG